MITDTKSVADRLRLTRKKSINPSTGKPYTQSEFAHLLGTSQPTIADIERGVRPVSKNIIVALREKIGVDILENKIQKSDDVIDKNDLQYLIGVRDGRIQSLNEEVSWYRERILRVLEECEKQIPVRHGSEQPVASSDQPLPVKEDQIRGGRSGIGSREPANSTLGHPRR